MIGELIRAGRLSEAEAQKSRLRNRLTRSVGTRPQVEVELSPPIPLAPGDLILLCTDGLTQYATPNDLLAAAVGQPAEIVERLIAFANQQGGSDNVSVAAIWVRDPAPLAVSLPRWAQMSLLVALGAALLLVGLLAGLLPGSLSGWMATPTPTPTSTAAPTHTPTLTPSIMPTSTSTLTATPTPTPLATTPADSPFPATPTHGTEMPNPTASAAATAGRVTCAYVVQPRDTLLDIARRFEIPPENITSPHRTLTGKETLQPGETLLLRQVLQPVCLANGGIIVTSNAKP